MSDEKSRSEQINENCNLVVSLCAANHVACLNDTYTFPGDTEKAVGILLTIYANVETSREVKHIFSKPSTVIESYNSTGIPCILYVKKQFLLDELLIKTAFNSTIDADSSCVEIDNGVIHLCIAEYLCFLLTDTQWHNIQKATVPSETSIDNCVVKHACDLTFTAGTYGSGELRQGARTFMYSQAKSTPRASLAEISVKVNLNLLTAELVHDVIKHLSVLYAKEDFDRNVALFENYRALQTKISISSIRGCSDLRKRAEAEALFNSNLNCGLTPTLKALTIFDCRFDLTAEEPVLVELAELFDTTYTNQYMQFVKSYTKDHQRKRAQKSKLNSPVLELTEIVNEVKQ